MMQTHQAYMQRQQQQFLQQPQVQQPNAMPSPIGQQPQGNDGSMLARLRAASQSREARGTFGMGEFSAIAPDESENFLSK